MSTTTPSRRNLSALHRRAFLFGALLSVVVLGTALGLVCGQATYNRGFEWALYVGGTQRTARWAIAHTAILSNADQIAMAAWAGVAAIYYLTAITLLYMGRYSSPALRSGVDVFMLFLVGLSGCAVLAWTMAYKWQAYSYCHSTFKMEALALCNLAIVTIVLGWVLAGYSLVVGVAEAALVARRGAGGFRTSFPRLEAPPRRRLDFSRLTVPHARAPPPGVPWGARAAGPPGAQEKEAGSASGSAFGSASGSEASTMKGSEAAEYAGVATLPWGAPNAAAGEEVLATPVSARGATLVRPPLFRPADAPVLDAARVARPGRIPVDRGSGYVADGQAGRGVRSPAPRSNTPPRSPRRFLPADRYTRPLTPPTRRAGHQRSLSQAEELAPAVRASTYSHTRARSWDYI